MLQPKHLLLPLICLIYMELSFQECQEKAWCSHFSNECDTPTYKSILDASCPITCNLCKVKKCEDKRRCKSWSKRRCFDPLLRSFMKATCPLLCDACPKVATTSNCTDRNGGCDQWCTMVERKVECSCQSGFKLVNQVYCEDVNECAIEWPCGHHSCINMRGGYHCSNNSCASTPGIFNKYRSNECCITDGGETCGADATSQAGTHRNTEKVDSRIIGGRDAFLGAWPWMVQLFINNRKLCGGTLISDSWVISAAHCFSHVSRNSTVDLYFGRISFRATLQEEPHVQHRIADEVIFRDEWRRYQYMYHDIILIHLNRPVILNNFVNIVCLPNGERPVPGTRCWTTGFGTTSPFSGQPASVLQEVDLIVQSTGKCEHAYVYTSSPINSDIMFCAGHDSGGKDACQGDSGGPLVCQRCSSCAWYLSGVTSFGKGCARPKSYGVYTNVEYYEKWISNITGIATDKSKVCRKSQFQTRWSRWGMWGVCSRNCGGGRMSRTRVCVHGRTGDAGCLGSTTNTTTCNTSPCVDNSENVNDFHEGFRFGPK